LPTTATEDALCRIAATTGDRARRGHHQPGGVDRDGQPVVLPDQPDAAPAEVAQLERGPQVVAGQRDVGGLHRHVGAADTHRDADVRQRERGRVVGAVADHGHRVPLGPQRAHHVLLLLGQNLGAELVDAQLGGHRGGGLRMITGEQHDPLDPVGAQRVEYRARLRTHGVAR
jgi:hypothetical protein